MRGVCRFAAAVAVLVAPAIAARAEDPAPAKAKHENKVTPEAKAAMDRFREVVYRPRDHGLVSAKGVVVPIGFESHERPVFELTADGRLRTEGAREIEEERRRLKLAGNCVDYPLSTAFDASDVFADAECDATVVERDGARVLVLDAFRNGRTVEQSEFELDSRGLVVRHGWRGPPDDARGGYTTKYTWAPCGAQFRIVAVEVTMRAADATHYACSYRYADVAGLQLVTSYEMTYFVKSAEPRRFAFHVSDLVVNGKPVELPKPWKHVNVVSAEAKAAIERYARLSYRPAEHGLASFTGTFFHPASGREPNPYTFEFKAGRGVEVHGGPNDPVPERDRMTRFMMAIPLHAALAGVLLVEGDEYDARVEDRQGTDVLVVTTYADGVVGRTDEFTFDGEGLVATAAIDVESKVKGPVASFRMAWERRGALRRISVIDFRLAWPGESNPVRYRHEVTYTQVDGIDVVSGYAVHPGTGRDGFSPGAVSMRLVDLVVNGKKVEASALPAPAGDAKK